MPCTQRQRMSGTAFTIAEYLSAQSNPSAYSLVFRFDLDLLLLGCRGTHRELTRAARGVSESHLIQVSTDSIRLSYSPSWRWSAACSSPLLVSQALRRLAISARTSARFMRSSNSRSTELKYILMATSALATSRVEVSIR